MRRHLVADMLSSYRELIANMNCLTLEELMFALELEAGTQRRPSVISRLIKRVVSVESSILRNNLKEKYYGP
jgi:hypothetical protein